MMIDGYNIIMHNGCAFIGAHRLMAHPDTPDRMAHAR